MNGDIPLLSLSRLVQMDNDCIAFLSVIVVLLVVADVCESMIKENEHFTSFFEAENSDNCLYQTLSGIFPRHIHADFSEPTLVEPLAKFRRGKSIQQRINRAVHWQNKDNYPGMQIS